MPILMVDPFKYFSVGLHFLGQEFCIQDINLPCDTIMGSHCSANPTLYRQLLALYCKHPEHWIELCVYFHICVYTYMSTLSTAGKHWQQVNHASCIPRAFCWIWLGLASAIRCQKQWTWWISLCFFSPVCANSWPNKEFLRRSVRLSLHMCPTKNMTPRGCSKLLFWSSSNYRLEQ